MNILLITPTLPYPPTDGTRIRLFSLIKHLSVRHSISLVSFVLPEDAPEALDNLAKYCDDILTVPRNPRYSWVKLARGLIGDEPFPILQYKDARMAAAVHTTLRKKTFDIVQAEALHMAQYATGMGCSAILDMFDVYSLVFERYARQERNPLKRAYAKMTARKVSGYEHAITEEFSRCLVASGQDATHLGNGMQAGNLAVIPNGVDVAYFSPCRNESIDNNKLLFLGRMDYAANMDAVIWFAKEVLPRIKERRPDVVFEVAGKNPVKCVRELARPGITVTGTVDDVRPYLSQAAVMVVPLRVGSGTRLKILEGLAMAKAIVTTTVGAEGLAVTSGKDILIADEAGDFAHHVLSLLDHSDLRARLARQGRLLVEGVYSWNTVIERLEDVYRTAVTP